MNKIVAQSIDELDSGKTPEWIIEHMRVYRETGGADGHMWDGSAVGLSRVPCLLLTTIGQRSGQKRTSPLVYGKIDEEYIVIGSKGGADTHPRWYYNVRANPAVEVQVGKAIFRGLAHIAKGEERERIWAQMVRDFPFYGEYQKRTTREIPVIVIRKQPA